MNEQATPQGSVEKNIMAILKGGKGPAYTDLDYLSGISPKMFEESKYEAKSSSIALKQDGGSEIQDYDRLKELEHQLLDSESMNDSNIHTRS